METIGGMIKNYMGRRKMYFTDVERMAANAEAVNRYYIKNKESKNLKDKVRYHLNKHKQDINGSPVINNNKVTTVITSSISSSLEYENGNQPFRLS